MIRLVPVDASEEDHVRVLWDLLLERTQEQSISHKAMPSLREHRAFVERAPYAHWYLVMTPHDYVAGSVYLSHQREIGVSILRYCQRRGLGEAAVRKLMETHPGRFLANVNPRNAASRRLWGKLGFRELQLTYVKEP